MQNMILRQATAHTNVLCRCWNWA